MLIFLQEWRSTLIPAVAIPVSLVGAFAFIQLAGFSINTLTLFGIVLATGLVVDDAIAIRSIAYLALTFDHRLIDGALADQFTAKVKSILENWSEDVL